MECFPLYLGDQPSYGTPRLTGYALTVHNISTSPTMKTKITCPGDNPAATLNCEEGEQPRSDGWTIHMGTALIKRGRLRISPESNALGASRFRAKPLSGKGESPDAGGGAKTLRKIFWEQLRRGGEPRAGAAIKQLK